THLPRRGVRYSEPRGLLFDITRGVRSTSPRGVADVVNWLPGNLALQLALYSSPNLDLHLNPTLFRPNVHASPLKTYTALHEVHHLRSLRRTRGSPARARGAGARRRPQSGPCPHAPESSQSVRFARGPRAIWQGADSS